MCGEEEERWLPSGNQSDDDTATCQKNQPDSVISDGDWYYRDAWSEPDGSGAIFAPQERIRALAPADSASEIWLFLT